MAAGLIVDPIVSVLLLPISKLFNYNFSLLQKDVFVVGFFIMDRFVSDILETILLSKNIRDPRPFPYSYLRKNIYKNNKKLKKIFSLLFLWERKLEVYVRNRLLTEILKKSIAVILPAALAIKLGPPTDLEKLALDISNIHGPFILLFSIIYFIPILPAVAFIFYSFFDAVSFIICNLFYMCKYIFFYIINDKYRLSSGLAFKGFSISESAKELFNLTVKQVKFNLTFTALFFLIIGLNYKYLN